VAKSRSRQYVPSNGMSQIGARTSFAGLEGRAFASLLNGPSERQEKDGEKSHSGIALERPCWPFDREAL
jgi:hypothetical protein